MMVKFTLKPADFNGDSQLSRIGRNVQNIISFSIYYMTFLFTVPHTDSHEIAHVVTSFNNHCLLDESVAFKHGCSEVPMIF